MSLSLKITSYQRLTPGQQEFYHADSDAFTIGRNSENEFAIPDPQRFLSGVHCRIHRDGDNYFITDTSTNGVFLNGSEQRMQRNESVALHHNDKFRIGDYEFEVLINDESLAGNPLTSDDETMIGADPFDDPFSASDQRPETGPAAETDPFSDDDPFSDPQPAEHSTEQDDEFQKDLNTPLAQLDNNALGQPVSIDSLMDFDDDDADIEEQQSAAELEQHRSPLREAFEPPRVDQALPANNPAAADSPVEIPDNWDETTGLLRIPEKNVTSETPEALEIPDDWDATTGLLKVPEAPPAAPPEAPPAAPPNPAAPVPTPTPPPTAVPAPPPEAKPARHLTPTTPAVAQPPLATGNAALSFARGAGLNPDDVAGIDQDVLFEQVGRMLIMFTEGLIQTLSGRTHIKSEFRLDQTMIRPAENNPFKFSTSKTRTLLQLLSKSDPAYMTGVHAISEGFDDVNAHQMAVVAGMEAALQDILSRFNPKTLETRMVSDSVLAKILPGGKKARYWDIFKLLFDEIAGEAEDNFQQLFGREFSRAYEDQLARLKNARKE